MKPQIMKNLANYPKTVLLLVAFCTTLIGNANEDPIYISRNEDKIIELTLNKVKPGNFFAIKDEGGIELYKEAILNPGTFTKEFDLNTLPIGSYFIELDKTMERITFPFEVTNKEAIFDDNDAQSIFKLLTKVKDGHILISQLNLDLATLEVKIFRENEGASGLYELVHSEKIKNTKNIKRTYKLSNYKKGVFKITFITKGQEFTKYF